MSIFPYVYRMVENFGVTTNTTSIAMYAGMITSAFAFAEFSAGVWWGKLSDKVGRKPVLIGGLVGTALSMILFGFAPSLPVAILARALGGLLNGNIGVIQTTVAEIITHKKQQARAFSIMPFVWCMGSIIGPAIGGALSQPAINFPNYFAKGGLFDQFPFLLPNLICTMVLVCGIVVGILFLEETHAEKKHQRDYGREAGSWLIKRLRKEPRPAFIPITTLSDKALESMLDVRSASEDLPEAPPGYSMVNLSENTESRIPEKKAKVPVTKAFTKQIIMIIFGYGLLA
jgi:MFS family permease